MFTLFDVGANWGTDSLVRTRDNPLVRCFAFEPTPRLIEHLTTESMPYRERYMVLPFAVSDFDGTADFHVAQHADWGVSSLHTFSDNLANTWRGRHDFYVDQTINVVVHRLDTWLRSRPDIDRIDFFHCDTQGSDLAVLRGMGEYLSLIVEGVVETPETPEKKLYREQHTQEEMRDFLSDNHFDIIRIEKQQNEDNLVFRRRV